MWSFNGVKIHDIIFEEYQCWVDKWKNNNDFREVNIQNDVIKPFIQSICIGLDVVDVSKKGPETELHDYLKYCGTYVSDDGKRKPTTPDLVVAKDWNWKNKENKVEYHFTVEVKSPFLNECIYKKDTYPEELKIKIKRHLSAKENNKVVLTDGVKWIFYKKTLEHPQIFCLYAYENDTKEWRWKSDDNEFIALKEYIKQF